MKNFISSLLNRKGSSESFDSEIKKLWMIPEKNWYEGRRRPCITLIQNVGSEFKRMKVPMGPSNYLSVIKFNVGKGKYIYFELIIETSTKPIVEWFQFEEIDSTYGEDVYKTKLVLSSDNGAKTQGAALMYLFEKQG